MPCTLSFSLAVPQAFDVSYSSGFIFDECAFAFAPPAGAAAPAAAAAAAAVWEFPDPRRLSPVVPAAPLDPLEARCCFVFVFFYRDFFFRAVAGGGKGEGYVSDYVRMGGANASE